MFFPIRRFTHSVLALGAQKPEGKASGAAEAASAATRTTSLPLQRFAPAPAVFIEKQGQWNDASVRFALRSRGGEGAVPVTADFAG